MDFVIPTVWMIIMAYNHLRDIERLGKAETYKQLLSSVIFIWNQLGFGPEDIMQEKSIQNKLKELDKLRRKFNTGWSGVQKGQPTYLCIFDICRCQCWRRMTDVSAIRDKPCQCGDQKPRMHGKATANNVFLFFRVFGFLRKSLHRGGFESPQLLETQR